MTIDYEAYGKAYYAANKEKMLAQMKAYREANPGKQKEHLRRWIAANEGHTYLDSSGYVNYVGFEHPATNPSGITREHRVILWDKLKGKGAMCHWGCGKWVSWAKTDPQARTRLVTDHINLIKNDNRPENLVPSCAQCNASRTGGRTSENVAQGEDNGMSKLSNAQVIEIKTRLLAGETSETIAQDYPVDAQAIHAIHRGKTWLTVGPAMAGTYTPSYTQTDDNDKTEIVARVKAGHTIAYIADDLGLCPSSVSRNFKRLTGMSVREYGKLFKAGLVA